MIEKTGIYVSFFVYALLIIFISILFYKRSKRNLSSFFLGDRDVNPWVTALSAQASDMSAWLFMSLPAAAYLYGFEAAWIAIGLACGTYLNWKIVAQRLRNFTVAFGDSITIPQYLQNRFKTNTITIRIVCSIIILIFFLLYVASGFSAEAKLFQELFGLQYRQGLFIGAITIMSYTFVGGFLTVSWTDFFQSILMFFALLAIPCILIISGNEEEIKEILSWQTIKQSAVPEMANGKTDWGDIVSGLGWGLGYFGMPHILIRFMAVKSATDINLSRRVAMVWVVLTLVAALLIGILGNLYLTENDFFYESQTTAERIFMRLSTMLFHPLIAGVLLSAILAAVMSTVSSQLLVVGSAMVNDIYCSITGREKGRFIMILSKLSIIVVTFAAIVIAWYPESSVMGFVSYAWAGFGATFAPVVILSLTWKRLNLQGSLYGMIVGAISVITWESFGLYNTTGLSAIVPCFIISSLSIIFISLVTQKPCTEIIDTFDRAKKM